MVWLDNFISCIQKWRDALLHTSKHCVWYLLAFASLLLCFHLANSQVLNFCFWELPKTGWQKVGWGRWSSRRHIRTWTNNDGIAVFCSCASIRRFSSDNWRIIYWPSLVFVYVCLLRWRPGVTWLRGGGQEILTPLGNDKCPNRNKVLHL